MDGLHGVRSLVQRPHELEVEDAADQAADTARREEDHLKGNRGRETVIVPPGLHLHQGAPAGLMSDVRQPKQISFTVRELSRS